MAITDRARDFWDRISPRERNLVVLLGVALPITLALWLGFAIHDGLVAMEKRNDDTRKALDIVETLHAKGPATPVDDTVATLPNEPISLNTYLTNAATKAGFTLKGTTPHGRVTKNHFITESSALQVSDLTLDQMKKFLQEIETGDKHTVVTSIDLRKNFKNSKDGHLDANIEVSTFGKEKEGAGSGSGSGGSGSGAAAADGKKGG